MFPVLFVLYGLTQVKLKFIIYILYTYNNTCVTQMLNRAIMPLKSAHCGLACYLVFLLMRNPAVTMKYR